VALLQEVRTEDIYNETEGSMSPQKSFDITHAMNKYYEEYKEKCHLMFANEVSRVLRENIEIGEAQNSLNNGKSDENKEPDEFTEDMNETNERIRSPVSRKMNFHKKHRSPSKKLVFKLHKQELDYLKDKCFVHQCMNIDRPTH